MSSVDSQLAESWINAFCSLVGHEYFAEVSEDFVEDDFNLTGLQSQVPMYKEALEMILDVEPEDVSDEDDDEEDEDEDVSDTSMHDREIRRNERRHIRMASDLSVIESSAEMLYGLIHQRFITSRPGIQQMLEKYEMGHFGTCPRVHCRGAKVLPVGCTDIPGHETVKLFCPACLDVYAPPNSRFQNVDGAFFGTTFGCLFFMTFPELDVGGSRPVENAPSTPAHSSSSLSAPSTGNHVSSLIGVQRPAAINTLSPTDTVPAPHSFNSNTLPSQPQLHSSTQYSSAANGQQPQTINGVPAHNLAPGLGTGNIYDPRIYGFRVSELAKSGPRMKWLRSRPADINDLDEVAIWERAQLPTRLDDHQVPPPTSMTSNSIMTGDGMMRDSGDGDLAVQEEDAETDMRVQDEEEVGPPVDDNDDERLVARGGDNQQEEIIEDDDEEKDEEGGENGRTHLGDEAMEGEEDDVDDGRGGPDQRKNGRIDASDARAGQDAIGSGAADSRRRKGRRKEALVNGNDVGAGGNIVVDDGDNGGAVVV